MIQTDCPIVAGDSGGPVFDLDGQVIGINSRIGGGTDQNLHVPVDIFHAVLGPAGQRRGVGTTACPAATATQVKTAFRPVVAEASRCVVRVKCDGQDAALGTIVGPDGWILTKASELKGKIVCRLRDQRELEARIVGVSRAFDLAMLKVEADRAAGHSVGQAGSGRGPMGGHARAGARARWPSASSACPAAPIPPISGMMGVVLADGEGGALIESLMPQAPAEKAGLKAKDVLTHVDGKPVKNREEAVTAIKRIAWARRSKSRQTRRRDPGVLDRAGQSRQRRGPCAATCRT